MVLTVAFLLTNHKGVPSKMSETADKERLIHHAQSLLNDKIVYNKMSNAVSPYGKGNSAKKIRQILDRE